jgi:hypothetical protein
MDRIALLGGGLIIIGDDDECFRCLLITDKKAFKLHGTSRRHHLCPP